MRCPNCNSTDIDTDASRGDSACMQCGYIMAQNAIVSEVGFVEGADGSSSVLGQFVSATGSARLSASAKTRGPGGRGPSVGYQKDSREQTITNGRRAIQQVADHLRLRAHHVDSAVRLFMLAVQHNFIQGRRTAHVVASCLYIVCRREKTPHLLIDFSDVLQINLYILGATFLKFVRLLNLSLPIIDPSLYIHRFAAQLELKDKEGRDRTHLVAMTALRLVARMKRDWILVGRRPSGICGASLLIASRMHGFRRTQKEIIYVVKVCDLTLRKRLAEFTATKSANLTLEEFEKMDVETINNSRQIVKAENDAIRARNPHAALKEDPYGVEQDPPAFTRNRDEEKEAPKIMQERVKMFQVKQKMLSDLDLDLGAAQRLRQKQLQVPFWDPSSESAHDREMAAIQAESRRLFESNEAMSESIVAKIQDMMKSKKMGFALLDEGPQKQVSLGDGGTRVHVTPLPSPLVTDGPPHSASAAAAASSSASAAATPVPSTPITKLERLKSVRGPNLAASRSRPARAGGAATPAPAAAQDHTSILLPKDAQPMDVSRLFAPPPSDTAAAASSTSSSTLTLNELRLLQNVGDPLADALVVASDPSLLLVSDSTAATNATPLSVPIEPDISKWTDLDDFDAEIESSIKLSDEETAFKTQAWESIHKEYLAQQAEKAAQAESNTARSLGPDGQPIPKRHYKKKPKASGAAATPAEAAMRVLAEKRYSDKINYNALEGLLAKLEDKPAAEEKKPKLQRATEEDEDEDEDEEMDEEEEEEEGDDDGASSLLGKRGVSSLHAQLPSAKRRMTATNDGDDEDDGDADEDADERGDEDEEVDAGDDDDY